MVNPNANKASRLWASLMCLSYDLKVKYKTIETYPEYDFGPSSRVTPLVELEMDIKVQSGIGNSQTDGLLSVSMDTLVNLVDEFDRIKELYPSKSTGQILGTNFGDSKLDFLRGFVEYKKTQHAKESCE